MNRRGLRGYLVLTLVFALGAAAGAGGAVTYVHQRRAALFRDDARGFEDRRVRGLARKLDLDDAQRDKVRAILDTDREETRALGRDMFEHCGQPLRDHKAKVDAAIRATLRPDQQTKFDALVEERKERTWIGGGRGGR